eukprot:CAMPEP_0183302128 /NCGR_PEP_ID=MMETSP0160_2-20130417/8026_1 /TAXON_ID=2839 ORGANISM="Odontella Sinensis, Strain Grunow 1884" /NCGR_SAMPLE_ID=MMETSP0160_2 /ASSEMBLY_ACC=CAM_ASM_000250 /LENGTH=150 /DNA_ID=CAMNT_0025464859 /DNA_START=119 /DNA_END=569 /DNA_ORIENTATION=+
MRHYQITLGLLVTAQPPAVYMCKPNGASTKAKVHREQRRSHTGGPHQEPRSCAISDDFIDRGENILHCAGVCDLLDNVRLCRGGEDQRRSRCGRGGLPSAKKDTPQWLQRDDKGDRNEGNTVRDGGPRRRTMVRAMGCNLHFVPCLLPPG